MNANLLGFYETMGTLAKANARTAVTRSARVAGVAKEGQRLLLDGMTAQFGHTASLMGALAKARTPSDVAALQRSFVEAATARATEDMKAFLALSGKLVAEDAATAVDAVAETAPAPTAAVEAEPASEAETEAEAAAVTVAEAAAEAVDEPALVADAPAVEAPVAEAPVAETAAAETAAAEAPVDAAAPTAKPAAKAAARRKAPAKAAADTPAAE